VGRVLGLGELVGEGPSRGFVDGGGWLLAVGFMRPDLVEVDTEGIEPALLSGVVSSRRDSGIGLEVPVHAFVTAVLLGGSRLDEVSDQTAETSAPGRAEVTIPELTVRAMAGSYRSTELSSTWVLEALGSDLILHHPSGDTTTLEPHGEMLLSSQGIQLLFVSEAGEVAAFVLDAGRVRNIRFDRVR
jgi:hypothetical protein